MLKTQKLHNQQWPPSLIIIDRTNRHNFGRDPPRSILTKFCFILSSGSGEEDFERFPIIQQIRSHGSHFVYRARLPDTVLKKDHPRRITSKSDPIWPSGFSEDQMWKVNRWWLTDARCQVMGKTHLSLQEN